MTAAQLGGATVLSVVGDVDIDTASALRDQLDKLQADGVTTIVVDLADVGFLDSSGLGVIVTAHRALTEAGGSLRIARPRPHVQKVFSITRLADVVPVFDTVDAALA